MVSSLSLFVRSNLRYDPSGNLREMLHQSGEMRKALWLFVAHVTRSTLSLSDGSANMCSMTKKQVRFVATTTVTKPTTVKFKTKSGKTVSFRAFKTYKKKDPVHFRAKRK
jgi:hypothetical protein